MKSDLDALMQAHDVDALLITGPGQHNPYMVYMTGGGHLTHADLIKRRGHDPLLFHAAMERDEAAKTGLPTKQNNDKLLYELVKQANGDLLQAQAGMLRWKLEEAGVTSGRLAIYGQGDAGQLFGLFTRLQALLPELEIVTESGPSLILQAMTTKDEDEVARIRRMGQITTGVVGQVADFLSSQRIKDNILVGADGQPVTIGDVKRRINLWLAERGAENPEGTIFAIGRDAGVPHSSGNASDQLELGRTIVFDIFPCEAGGGYFYDFTRTWCLGYAPDEAQALYDDVLSVYQQVMSELQMGQPARQYQLRTCELFQAQGHPTVDDHPGTQEGYVHSLGHGLGLHVHEEPKYGVSATDKDRLDPGVVTTIEPGLYYPERGMGVRLEDTVYISPQGQIEVLAPYPLDLVLPIKG